MRLKRVFPFWRERVLVVASHGLANNQCSFNGPDELWKHTHHYQYHSI